MICGVDEAGKGPVIGPLVVAAVKIKNAKDIDNLGVKDSKQLTSAKRKELAEIIKSEFDFTVDGDNIRFGLNSIKGVSSKSLQSLSDFRDSDNSNKYDIFLS